MAPSQPGDTISVATPLVMAALPDKAETHYEPGTVLFTSALKRLPDFSENRFRFSDSGLTTMAYALSPSVVNLNIHRATIQHFYGGSDQAAKRHRQSTEDIANELMFSKLNPDEFEIYQGVPYPLYPDVVDKALSLMGVLQINASADSQASVNFLDGTFSSQSVNGNQLRAHDNMTESNDFTSNNLHQGWAWDVTNYWGPMQATDRLSFVAKAYDMGKESKNSIIGIMGNRIPSGGDLSDWSITQLEPVVTPSKRYPDARSVLKKRPRKNRFTAPNGMVVTKQLIVENDPVVGNVFVLGNAALSTNGLFHQAQTYIEHNMRNIKPLPNSKPIIINVICGSRIQF